ncbi:MAG: hypothetical protein H7343_24090 [Undibacterium sp.]|nr:hypothetical protein [Opitutaceae bacterium]
MRMPWSGEQINYVDQEKARDMTAFLSPRETLLGDRRYLEYAGAQDTGYRAAVGIASHVNLPSTAAAEAYAAQEALELGARKLTRADKTVVAAQASALLAEANAQFVKLLGVAGADAYKKSGGFWMRGVE